MLDHCDVLIVGGGSAGAVLAHRLSAQRGLKVVLLEAGADTPPDNTPDIVKDTYYQTLYEPGLFWPDLKVHHTASARVSRPYEQARVMGGGSAVNAMIGLRGLPGDYDEWVDAGATGWGWSDLLPYFKKIENDQDFSGELHGNDGRIPIRRHTREQWPRFCKAVASHLRRQGWEDVDDMNGEPKNGLCRVPMTSTSEHRVSSAMAYLDAATRKRSNLHIVPGAYVEKLLFEHRKVIGAMFRPNGRGAVRMTAGRVIVCAGSLHSPAILLRSGLGDATELRHLGIDVVAHRPGVGRNLQDHPMVSIASHLKPDARQLDGLRAAANLGLRYDSNVPGCHRSDMYVSVANKGSWHAVGKQIGALALCLYKPYSRGRVSLQSASADQEPNVNFNLLDDERDLQRMVLAVQFAAGIYQSAELRSVVNEVFPAGLSDRMRKLNQLSAFNARSAKLAAFALDGPSFLRSALLRHVVSPGPSLDHLLKDDTELLDWLKEKVIAFYHPTGSCRMGATGDSGAVVDPSGRVIGVEGLFVADASIMPTIPRANTNLTALVIGEKISDQFLKAE